MYDLPSYIPELMQTMMLNEQGMLFVAIALDVALFAIYLVSNNSTATEFQQQIDSTGEKPLEPTTFKNASDEVDAIETKIDSTASYSCPTCGKPIVFGATKCSACGQDIVWQ